MAYELTGTLFSKSAIIEVTEKFKKREFVIEVPGTYPEFIKLQLINDKCGLLDGMKQGETLKVTFNLKGKGSQNKQGEMVFYNNLDAWKIEKAGESVTTPPTKQQPKSPAPQPVAEMENTDDLPF